jgi:diadenosine tetraphosphate (Ap4A) HIT family hydrolase
VFPVAGAAPENHVPSACPLCEDVGGSLIWRDAEWRVVRVPDPDFPAYYRLISEAHVVELSDLAPPARVRCLELMCVVEHVVRTRLAPSKINLAALGNRVPHLHWHVIARFDWDSHFPNPIWGERLRHVAPPAAARLAVGLGELDAAVAHALANPSAE